MKLLRARKQSLSPRALAAPSRIRSGSCRSSTSSPPRACSRATNSIYVPSTTLFGRTATCRFLYNVGNLWARLRKEGLSSSLRRNFNAGDRLLPQIENDARSFAGNKDFQDDVCLLMVQWSP